MGSFLDKPRTEKETHVETNDELQAAISAMQGWRVDMEDAHSIKLSLDEAKDYSWFAVFDGHGGALVSQHSSANVLQKITSSPEWKADHRTPEGIGRAMVKGFLEMDKELRELPAVRVGEDHSGSTAIAALVTPTHIIVANCGDSRCVLVRKSGTEEMSEDHKPYNDVEKRRIEGAGGSVTMRRVNGDLAVSRALGDFVYKHRSDLPAEAQQVSAEPEIKIVPRSPDDQFLVLACDGIWDVMTSTEVGDFVAHKAGQTADVARCAEDLLEECLSRGSRDNMSAIIVAMPAARAAAAAAAAAGSGAAPHAAAAPAEGAAAAGGAPAADAAHPVS